jgi:hypothetical protein
MAKIFDRFSDIEEEVAEKAPPIIYKYRDWSNEYHPTILTDNSFWLAHPKELNDPYDIRVPVRFDYSEVDTPAFLERLRYQSQRRFPQINPSSREFIVIVENQYDLIRENPTKHFEENYLEMRESDLFDIVGVFSASTNPLNETMWAHYGNNGQGFCVGLETVEIVRNSKMSFGFVTYKEEPVLFSFLKPEVNLMNDEAYLKHSKWAYEEEFRLVSFNIKSKKDRILTYPSSALREVLVGINISNENLDAITKVLKTKYKGNVPLFQVETRPGSYGFAMNPISY